MVLEKTVESPLDSKEIQPVHPKGDQSWVFIGRTDVEAGMVLIPVSCTMSWTFVHISSGTLSIRFSSLNLLLTFTIIIRDLILVIPEWSSGFPYFLQFKSEFGNKGFMIWAAVSSQSCFCWLYRASPSLAAKNIINLISVLTIWWCPCVESSLVLLEEGVCYMLEYGIYLSLSDSLQYV